VQSSRKLKYCPPGSIDAQKTPHHVGKSVSGFILRTTWSPDPKRQVHRFVRFLESLLFNSDLRYLLLFRRARNGDISIARIDTLIDSPSKLLAFQIFVLSMCVWNDHDTSRFSEKPPIRSHSFPGCGLALRLELD
jgi:hypothetical protein